MWYSNQNQQVTIYIFAKANAKKTILLGATEQQLLISIHAKPHHGQANVELIGYLAQLLHVPKTQLMLQRGKHSKHKQVIAPLTDALAQTLHVLHEKLKILT